MTNSIRKSDSLIRIAALACFATAAFFGLRSLLPETTSVLSTASAEVLSVPTGHEETIPDTTRSSELITQNIEDIRLGQRVVGRNPLREQTQPPSDIHPATWRTVRLRMFQHDVEYDLAFLRPVPWLESQNAHAGGSIHLQLHEMGLDGPAEVVAIEPCPEIEPDDGTGRNVVTGTMAHPGPNILYLDITGLEEPLGVTDTHPIWSESRQDFVKAGKLQIGEQFRTLTGESATLTALHPHRGPPEMVFNLEVDAEHVYCVSRLANLVHNSCPIDEFDVRNYGDFAAHPGDGLTGHELLQSAWLKRNLGFTRSSAAGKLNPAMALTEGGHHAAITAMQKAAGLHQKQQLLQQSARANILENVQLMKEAGVPREAILEHLLATRRYLQSIGL